MSLDQRLYGFLFEPAAGVEIARVQSLFTAAQLDQLRSLQATETQVRSLALTQLNQKSPVAQVPVQAFANNLSLKLALLNPAEWQLLGVGVALLPSIGRIARSMDGNFRRAIRTVLQESHIEALDALAKNEAFTGASIVFQAPSTVWKNMSVVQAAGVKAILQEVCEWPSQVSERALWKLPVSEQATSPIVTGLTIESIEVLCKILLPNHPWLLSSSQTH